MDGKGSSLAFWLYGLLLVDAWDNLGFDHTAGWARGSLRQELL